jgi:NADH:ubiquinone oxidoreductase subunit C
VVAVRAGRSVAALTEALAPARRDPRRPLSGAILVLPQAALLEAAGPPASTASTCSSTCSPSTGSAYPGHRGARFSVTYHIHAIAANERCSLRVHLDDGDTLPTVTGVWPAASFMEREVYDLFGVTFDGHPDLRKLVTPEDLEGHPLRKDFPLGETPTLFNDGRFLDPATFRAGMIGASAATPAGSAARARAWSRPIVQETVDEKGGDA